MRLVPANLAQCDGRLGPHHLLGIFRQRPFESRRSVLDLKDAQGHRRHMANVTVGVAERGRQRGTGGRALTHEIPHRERAHSPVGVIEVGHPVFVQAAVVREPVTDWMELMPGDTIQNGLEFHGLGGLRGVGAGDNHHRQQAHGWD